MSSLDEALDALALSEARRLVELKEELKLEPFCDHMYGAQNIDVAGNFEETLRQIRSIESTLIKEGYRLDGTRA